jgi:outer membrane protein assembly factor BamB
MSIDYSTEHGQLIIRKRPEGTVVWRSTFEMPIIQIVPLPASEGCLVLLDPGAKASPPTFENLLRVTVDGRIRWTAQLPESHDAFTGVAIRDGQIEAQTWKGQLVEIDQTTGKATRHRFVK